MAALEFPANPTPGEVFESWTWDGEKWNLTPVIADGVQTVVTAGAVRGDSLIVPSSADTTLRLGTVTNIQGDVTYDPATGKYTIGKAGIYTISAQVGWTEFGTGLRYAYIMAGGQRLAQTTFQMFDAHTYGPSYSESTVVKLNVGDTVEVVGFQNSGFDMYMNGQLSLALIENVGGGGGGGGSDGYTFVQDTEPTADTEGQTWYNTSTGDSFVWYDSHWVQTAPGGGGDGIGNGLKALHIQNSGDTDGIGGAWIRLNGMDASFNAIAGRTYKISAYCRFELELSAANGLGNLAVTRGTVYDNVNGLAFYRGALGPVGPGNVRYMLVEAYWTPTADIPNQLITVHAALDNSPAGIFSHRPRSDVQASWLAVHDVTESSASGGGWVGEAPEDGKRYVREDGGWVAEGMRLAYYDYTLPDTTTTPTEYQLDLPPNCGRGQVLAMMALAAPNNYMFIDSWGEGDHNGPYKLAVVVRSRHDVQPRVGGIRVYYWRTD